MKRGESLRARACVGALLGSGLALTAYPVAAQVGPVSTQNVFFNQAGNAHRGNYLDALAGAMYTTNATLTPTGTPDTLALVGLAGTTAREAPRLDLRLAADLTFVQYLKEKLATRPSGYLDGLVDLKIVPGVFSWFARETYNQILINANQPATPNNLESQNYLTTGPSLAWRATLQTTLSVDAVYSWVNSSSPSAGYVNIDNQRYGGDVKLDHAFSSSSGIYLGAAGEKVNYKDNVDNTDFTLSQAFAGYRFRNPRTVVGLSGGYARVKIATETSDHPIYNVSLSRVISPRQRLSLRALQQVTDGAELFRLNLDQPVVGPSPGGLALGQPFVYREFGVSWRFQGARTSFDLAFYDFKDRYIVTTAADSHGKNVSAFVARQLNPALNFDIGAGFTHTDFAAGGYTNSVTAITDLRWQLGRRLGLRFFYAYSIYTPSPFGYLANQVGVLATYALSAASLAPSGPGGEGVAPTVLLPTSPLSTQSPAPQVPQ